MKSKSSKRGDVRINQLSKELNHFLTSKTLKEHSLKRVGTQQKDTMLLMHLHMRTNPKSHANIDSTAHSKNILDNLTNSIPSFLNAHCISRNGSNYITQAIKTPHKNLIKQSIKINSKEKNPRYRSTKDLSIDSLKDLTKEFWHTIKLRSQMHNETTMKTPLKARKALQRSYQQLSDLKGPNPMHRIYKVIPKALKKEETLSSSKKNIGLVLTGVKEQIKKKFSELVRKNSQLEEDNKKLHETLEHENNCLKDENQSLVKQVQEVKDVNKELIKRNTKLVKRNIELNSEIKRNKNGN